MCCLIRIVIRIITVSIFSSNLPEIKEYHLIIVTTLCLLLAYSKPKLMTFLSHPHNMIGCFQLKPHPLFKQCFDLSAAHAISQKCRKICQIGSLSVRMLTREEVQHWPTARLHEELAYVLAWIRWHVAWDHNIRQWSAMNHDMEVLQAEIQHWEREEREARWRGRWWCVTDTDQLPLALQQDPDLACPLTFTNMESLSSTAIFLWPFSGPPHPPRGVCPRKAYSCPSVMT